MTDGYVELHAHSYYSLLDASSSPAALLRRAVELGLPALALTDHDGLYGAVEFWRAAQATGIKPIIGAELTLARGTHLTVLAETQVGYGNLSRIITVGQLAGNKGQPQLTIEDVARHATGLLCLSGCGQSALARAALADDERQAARAAGKLGEIFGRGRVWIELQRHRQPDDRRLNDGLLAAARATGLPLVATNDVHYATAEGHRLRDVLLATRAGITLTELAARPGSHNSPELRLKSAAEMRALFADLPEAADATLEIAARCDVSLDFSGRRTPAFPPQTADFPDGLPPGETAFSYLHDLCHAGLRARFRPVTPRAAAQLTHELTVIERAGLADYFLIVWDIVRHARRAGIRCQGRGSAANSLVAHILGITPVDPLRHNLLFERFLSERTDTMPDIDIDFASDRRDEVIAYVYARYGTEHAAMVCNVVTYQPRLALRDVCRALGFAAADVTRITADRISATQRGGLTHDDTRRARAVAADDEAGLLGLAQELAGQLVGTPRHLSVHAGGMLITAQPLVEVVPLERATKPGVVVAQWNKDSVEDAGLIKIDLLCLRTLDLVTEASELIAARTGAAPPIDALPLDDPAIYRLVSTGDTIGCFQVESRAQAQMLPRLKPTRFEDLVIQVSIVRPGPIQGGMVHPYLRRRRGEEAVSYLHPMLEPILGETLGIIIFQEQVIRVAMALAGFSAGEADLLRRAMSRARSDEAMGELAARFTAGALANGVAREVAEEMFRQLRGFATYGFCKSHAAAFALVAYQTLWLKVYHPTEFYCALLNHQPMGFYGPEVVIGDAQRHGVRVLRPDVNASGDACAVAGDDALRLGLRYLPGLGAGGIERLLAARAAGPFADLGDFCRRTQLPRGLVGAMIRAGAFDGLDGDRRQLLWTLGGLAYEEEPLVELPSVEAELPELSEREELAWDYELLGFAPGDHPLRLLRERLRGKGALSAAELATIPTGQEVIVAGLVVVRQAPPTAKGHLFLTLEDETGLVNLIVRPDLRARRGELLLTAEALAAQGRLQRDGPLPQQGSLSVVVRWVRLLALE